MSFKDISNVGGQSGCIERLTEDQIELLLKRANKNKQNKMGIKKAKKKPVEIEFIQYTDIKSAEKIVEWIGDRNSLLDISDKHNPHITIMTIEGPMIADVNDYVIKGVHGEFYPVKPDIFEKTYEVVEND